MQDILPIKRCDHLQLFSDFPSEVCAIGNFEILSDEKIGFFSSSKASGAAILKIFERANLWRKNQTTILSGFHSPLEREVLEILLKGRGRIIICPARSLEQMRLPKEWLTSLQEDRLLVISPFSDMPRISRKTAEKRNDFIVEIADRLVFGYISQESKIEKLRQDAQAKGKSFEVLSK